MQSIKPRNHARDQITEFINNTRIQLDSTDNELKQLVFLKVEECTEKFGKEVGIKYVCPFDKENFVKLLPKEFLQQTSD